MAAPAGESLLRGVCPEWPPFFARHGLLPDLHRALDAVGATHGARAAELSPPPGLIFEAFRYFSPEATRVIILPRRGPGPGILGGAGGRPEAVSGADPC